MPMMSLTELARLEEEFCWSRLEWRIDTIWSADCRVSGSSTPENTNGNLISTRSRFIKVLD